MVHGFSTARILGSAPPTSAKGSTLGCTCAVHWACASQRWPERDACSTGVTTAGEFMRHIDCSFTTLSTKGKASGLAFRCAPPQAKLHVCASIRGAAVRGASAPPFGRNGAVPDVGPTSSPPHSCQIPLHRAGLPGALGCQCPDGRDWAFVVGRTACAHFRQELPGKCRSPSGSIPCICQSIGDLADIPMQLGTLSRTACLGGGGRKGVAGLACAPPRLLAPPVDSC